MTRETFERYIETIDSLQEDEDRVRTKEIAKELKVKEPSVTEMLRKLKKKNLVKYEPYKGTILTEKGQRLAKDLTKKHSTLSDFLKILGVNEENAEEDACKVEHVVSTETMNKLGEFLRFIQESPEEPTWLEHYNHFIKTGEHPECDKREKKESQK
ncbi:MAG: metal-dependent transcriptional regulator [Hadesarchaea archaeon]|nr:metal-dependent transcriptional regulator [Hadesarchaea archaeon]